MTSATIAVEPDHLLSPAVTAHCFWVASCRHAVTDTPSPGAAASAARPTATTSSTAGGDPDV